MSKSVQKEIVEAFDDLVKREGDDLNLYVQLRVNGETLSVPVTKIIEYKERNERQRTLEEVIDIVDDFGPFSDHNVYKNDCCSCPGTLDAVGLVGDLREMLSKITKRGK